jgi:hypothetical protein
MTYRRPSTWVSFGPKAKPPTTDELKAGRELRRKVAQLIENSPAKALKTQPELRRIVERERLIRDNEEAEFLVGIFVAQHRNPKLSDAAWFRAEGKRRGMPAATVKKRCEAARRRYHADKMFQWLVIGLAHAELHPPPE